MAIDPIGVGAVANDGTGDPLRQAFQKTNANLAGLAGGASVFDETLKEWTTAEAFEATAITRDADGVVSSATVVWPDGSTGTFTRTTKNTTFLAIDAFTITHAASSKTVTQAAVSRNADGAVITKPALSVA